MRAILAYKSLGTALNFGRVSGWGLQACHKADVNVGLFIVFSQVWGFSCLISSSANGSLNVKPVMARRYMPGKASNTGRESADLSERDTRA